MAKLVLDIEPEVIKEAEHYANETHSDLSIIVQDFLKRISANKTESGIEKKVAIADWVKELTRSKTPTPDFDHKEEYHKHLEEKYGV